MEKLLYHNYVGYWEILTVCFFLKDFKVHTTEEFIEHCQDGALSIEVWGHRSQGFNLGDRAVDNVNVRSRSLSERYVCRSDWKQK